MEEEMEHIKFQLSKHSSKMLKHVKTTKIYATSTLKMTNTKQDTMDLDVVVKAIKNVILKSQKTTSVSLILYSSNTQSCL